MKCLLYLFQKNNFTSPECETMATCLDCIVSDVESEKKGTCFCKTTPNKLILKRSTSLKDSPQRSRSGSLLEKRSVSLSSLNRSRSVQKLDFSTDMSVDGSILNNSQGIYFLILLNSNFLALVRFTHMAI